MNFFSKIFGSKKMDEEQAEGYKSLSQKPEVFDDPSTQIVQFKNPSKKNNTPESETMPVTLPEAIRYVVDKWGKGYLLNRSFINVLNDFKVLKDFPAAKHIITNMQANFTQEGCKFAVNAIYEIYTDVVKLPRRQYQIDNRTNSVTLN